MKFGECLKIARENSGMTKTELAQKLGITMQSVSRYESSDIEPRISLVIDIAKVLDISLDDLMQVNEEKRIIRYNDYLLSALGVVIKYDSATCKYIVTKNPTDGILSTPIFEFTPENNAEFLEELKKLADASNALGQQVADDHFSAQFIDMILTTLAKSEIHAADYEKLYCEAKIEAAEAKKEAAEAKTQALKTRKEITEEILQQIKKSFVSTPTSTASEPSK